MRIEVGLKCTRLATVQSMGLSPRRESPGVAIFAEKRMNAMRLRFISAAIVDLQGTDGR
jgi:hypothetical protein